MLQHITRLKRRKSNFYWGFSQINNWEGLPQNHIPIFQHTMRKQEDTGGKTHWVEETASVQRTVIQRHQVAKSRPSATMHSALQCASICKATNSRRRANAHISINRLPSWRHRPPGPYLCIVLKHLIALHVVALEH